MRRLAALAVPVVALLSAAPSPAQVLAPNLLYTSIQPCRLIDTRLAGGAILAGSANKRTFNIVGVSSPGSLASQGGNPNGCPVPGFISFGPPQVQAVALNFVAVGPAGPGDLRAWPTDQPTPTASIINYTSVSGLNIANGIIVPVRQNSQGADITVQADVSATHVVVDVVGFFTVESATQAGAPNNISMGRNAGNPGLTTGLGNIAIGTLALQNDTTGSRNVAVGTFALDENYTGNRNTAIGYQALAGGLKGYDNAALGYQALRNSNGYFNTAVGSSALAGNFSGSYNTAVGGGALKNATGFSNTALGSGAGLNLTTGNNNIMIGHPGLAGEASTIRMGVPGDQTRTFIAGIRGATTGQDDAVIVVIDSKGQLGTASSSIRFKEDVHDLGSLSDRVLELRPVAFRYKKPFANGKKPLHYGLIAEEVERVFPELVAYGKDGKPETVKYQDLPTLLLNELEKEHRKVEGEEREITALRREVAELVDRLSAVEKRSAPN